MGDRAIGTVPPQPTRRRREAALELSAPETARDIGISSVAEHLGSTVRAREGMGFSFVGEWFGCCAGAWVADIAAGA
jgi:hypothetical protein